MLLVLSKIPQHHTYFCGMMFCLRPMGPKIKSDTAYINKTSYEREVPHTVNKPDILYEKIVFEKHVIIHQINEY